MSILIKNMKMPKACVFCELYEGETHWCRGVKKEIPYSSEDERADDCPLVPVPKHGRLIDADAAVVAIQNSIEVVHDGMQKILLDYAQKMFNATPTIIESEASR